MFMLRCPLLLLMLAAVVQCHVRTANNLKIPSAHQQSALLINDTRIAFSLCSENNTAQSSGTAKTAVNTLPQLDGEGVGFYVQRNNVPLALQLIWQLSAFEKLITLPPYRMGYHGVTVHSMNLSVSEIEAALNYAWKSAFDEYAASPSASPTDSPHVRLVTFLNSGDTLTVTGLPVARILYTIVMSNASNQTDGARWSSESRIPRLRISPPHQEQFIEKLSEKGINVYDQTVIWAVKALIRDPPSPLNLDRIRGDAQRNMEAMPNGSDPPCVQRGKVDVRIAGIHPRVRLPDTQPQGPYKTGSDMTYVNFAPFVDDRIYVQSDFPQVGEKIDSGFYAADPEFSFRLYAPEPVNMQRLPNLQTQMVRQLESGLTKARLLAAAWSHAGLFPEILPKKVVVILWNPDVENGTAINFFVRMTDQYDRYTDLDSRMLYADGLYERLEAGRYYLKEEQTNFGPADGILSRTPPARRNDTEWEAFQADCKEGRKFFDFTYSGCPLRDAFALHYLAPPNQTLSNESILSEVTSALSASNPVKLEGIQYQITITSRTELKELRTVRGYTVTRFDIAVTAPISTRGRIEHIWRFADFQNTVQLNDMYLFRVYPDPPINYQLLPAFEKFIQLWLTDDVHVCNPVLNGTVIDFLYMRDGAMVDPASLLGQRIYDALEHRQFSPQTSDPISAAKSAVSFTRQPKSRLAPATCVNQSLPGSASCPIPRTLSLYLRKAVADFFPPSAESETNDGGLYLIRKQFFHATVNQACHLTNSGLSFLISRMPTLFLRRLVRPLLTPIR
ncbi:uncharacterized protein LOC129589927 isoform X2 [Paramacrobiotus metropolitanus]|uniref:uncharacterized protein LOC129589927 isoform X2 n=1 Tax=Paramacrobiotus metropolitanus TaxID=2943436 RepID=UPI002445851D|nr:uncharacterized protein LOC129589927 isoform X2 [Paramacrobiotus metropolitanus]